MPLHHVKELLGHSNISQTDTYLNAGERDLQTSMRKLDDARRAREAARKDLASAESPGTRDKTWQAVESMENRPVRHGNKEKRSKDLLH
jgi:hypothetical protein